MPGLLRIKGVIELAQFWPDGSSDADTSKIRVRVDSDAFSFAADGETFKATHVFEGAYTVGKSKAPVIKNDRVTVRLQGIDAPELHYKAGALQKTRTDVTPKKREKFNKLNAHERRQYWAETGTVKLAEMLGGIKADELPCEVYSYVDHPYEVVDTYGRVVGNIRVGNDFKLDLNIWLVEQGLAFPTFYSSMSEEEIQVLLGALKLGRQKKRIWKDLTGKTNGFDPDLVYRKGGPIDAKADRGPVLMPKLFRRQVAYEMEKATKITKKSFVAYLAKTPDPCFELDDFLKAGVHAATPRRFDEFFDKGVFQLEPHEVVFKEKFSSVVDSNGDRIDQF